MSYLNFHAHSMFSVLDALPEPEEIARASKRLGNDAFVITDHGTLGSWIKAYKAAEKLDMQFIPGCEFYIRPSEDDIWTGSEEHLDCATKYHHLIAIAKSQEGVRSLIALFNSAEEIRFKGSRRDVPVITEESLFANGDGLIVANACVSGPAAYYLRYGMEDRCRDWLRRYKDRFGDDLYVEIQWHDLTFCDELYVYNTLVEMAREMNIRLLPTTDSHFVNKEDAEDHNIFKNIYRPGYVFDFKKGEFESAFNGHGYYIMNEQEIRDAISHITTLTPEEIDQAVANTVELRARCEQTHFPKAKDLVDRSEELRELVEIGWKIKRAGTDLADASKERIETELGVIENMHFTEYFINVRNIIHRAQSMGILVGPARGSAAGSEVCYLLDITKIDPIKNGLMFERFLNPERFNYPDIDMDIQSTLAGSPLSGKNSLIESLSHDLFPFSGQIVNETRASTLMLFKQLAKAFSLPFDTVNRITTDRHVADDLLMEDEYTGWLADEMRELKISYTGAFAKFEKYIPFAYKYGGNLRGDKADGILVNTAAHASGVILYPSKDPNILPKSSQGVTYRGHDLEEMGFIKYDLLGLSTLDPIAHFMPTLLAEKGVEATVKDENGDVVLGEDGKPLTETIFNWERADDPETWDVFCDGDTDFVFQFSSPGMKRALRITKPRTISKLAELNALYRPGCIKAGILEQYLTDSFSEDAKIVGEHLKKVFGEDHSYAMIFQEDIMKVVQDMAGFSLGEADLVRRAMQRKELDRMLSYKEKFIENFDVETYGNIAQAVWAAIEEFASYAFNKSHSVAYACIAYWTAYIYRHHKNELFEYMLGIDMDRQKVITFLSRDHRILFPSLKSTNTAYEVTDTELRIPTTEVTGQTPVEYLLTLDSSKKSMITRYGILDSFCVDRKGIRDLFDAIPKRSIDGLTDAQRNVLVKSRDLQSLIRSLSALDLIEFTKRGTTYEIEVKRPKSTKHVEISTVASGDVLASNCQEDIRRYGLIRERYADKAPVIPLDRIHSFFRNRYEGCRNDPDARPRDILRTAVRMAHIEQTTGKSYRCALKKFTPGKRAKVELVFADGEETYRVVSRDASALLKSVPKNTPLEVEFAVDSYYASSTDTPVVSLMVSKAKRREN